MVELTEVIKEDIQSVGQAVRGIFRGAVQGAYTPFLINTGLIQFINGINDSDNHPNVEIIAKSAAQVLSATLIHTPLAMYAIHQGRGKEYFGVMLISNSIDYLVHAYKRSKQE